MSSEQFELFLNACIGVCALGAVFNLFRFRTQPARSMLLAGAFVALGITIYMLRSGVSQTFVFIGGAVTALCLVFDFALRSSARKDLDEKEHRR